MKKHFLLLLILLTGFLGFAQDPIITEQGAANRATDWMGGYRFRKALVIPIGTHDAIYPNLPTAGRVQINSTTNKLEYHNGTAWVEVGSGTGAGTVTSVTGTNGVTVTTGTTTPVIGLGNITPTSVAATGNVTGENLSGTNTGDNSPNTNSNAYTDSAAATKADLNSPTFTGTPNVPTAAPGTNNIQAASTAFVAAAVAAGGGSSAPATTTTQGIVKLAGDLGGTADLPTVIQATTAIPGKIEIATNTETNTGSDAVRAVVPASLLNWWNTTRTTDNIVEGTVKKTVSITVSPPTAVSTIRLVTAPAEVPNTDHTRWFGKGLQIKLDDGAYSLNQNQRAGIITKFTGDSEMNGFLLTGAQSWVTQVTNQFGWSFIDNRTNGTKLIDKYKGLLDTDIAEIRFIGLGTNDARLYTTAGAATYANLYRGNALSAYEPYATKGQQMTLSGTDWTNDTYQANTTTGVTTLVNGATATFKRVGTTIYVTIALIQAGNATHTITIDGVTQTVLPNNDLAVFTTTGYPVPTGDATVNYYPYTYRFSGLSSGEHNVIITKTGGSTALRVMWALSNRQIGTNMTYKGISQYFLPITKMQPGTGNSTSGTGYAYWGGSDATIDAYNSAAKTIIYEFNDDELDMRLLDINKIFNSYVTGYLQPDLLHWTASFNKEVGDFAISKLTAYPVREQQRLDRLQEFLDLKVNVADLATTYGVLSANNSWTGTFNTFTNIRAAGIFNNTGSNTQGTLTQSTSNNGWGSVRNSTSATGAAFFAQQQNSSAVGDIADWYNTTSIVAGVRIGGQTYGANGTASNDYVTVSQLNNRPVTMVSAAYTILPSDYYIELTSGTFTITLPTAVGVTGKEYVIKNGNTGVMTLATTSSQTIDDTTTKTYNSQYAGVRVISNGTNWRVNGSF